MDLSIVSGLFAQHFKKAPRAIFFAPGRVNMMGEPISSSQNLELAGAIDLGFYLAVSQREDTLMRAVSDAFLETPRAWESSTLIAEDSEFDWSNDLQLLNQLMVSAFGPVKGMDVYIHSSLPAGAGLSASYSLLVAFAQALNALNDLKLTPFCIAQLCLQVKHSRGAATRVLSEPLTLVAAEAGQLLLLDGLDNRVVPVPFPQDWGLLLVDLKAPKGFVTSACLQRRAQCETAAHALGVSGLHLATGPGLEANADNLDAIGYARALHGVSENARCGALVEAFVAQDMPAVSRLMAASMASLRGNLDITTDLIDAVVRKLQSLLGERGGVRLTGLGFGGSLLVVVQKSQMAALQVQIASAFADFEVPKPVVMPIELGGGVRQWV